MVYLCRRWISLLNKLRLNVINDRTSDFQALEWVVEHVSPNFFHLRPDLWLLGSAEEALSINGELPPLIHFHTINHSLRVIYFYACWLDETAEIKSLIKVNGPNVMLFTLADLKAGQQTYFERSQSEKGLLVDSALLTLRYRPALVNNPFY